MPGFQRELDQTGGVRAELRRVICVFN